MLRIMSSTTARRTRSSSAAAAAAAAAAASSVAASAAAASAAAAARSARLRSLLAMLRVVAHEPHREPVERVLLLREALGVLAKERLDPQLQQRQ